MKLKGKIAKKFFEFFNLLIRFILVIFGFLNNGNDLDEAIFKKLLKKIYKKNSEVN